MLTLETLPAEYGDALWIEYGDPDAPHRILIDAGLSSVYKTQVKPKILALPEAERKSFELMVCTHIDADHIGGTLSLFREAGETGFGARDVWFNGYRHLPDEPPETLGPRQGEELTNMLVKPEWNWNTKFDEAAVMVPDEGELPVVKLTGGMKLTLLSPDAEKLAELKPVWEKECEKAGLIPSVPATGDEPEDDVALLSGGPPDVDALADERFRLDSSEANGSSIAFMLEYEGRKILLSGDAHPDILIKSLRRWSQEDKPSFDVFKLPHHGSKANISPDLVKAVDCKQWLFSTNGKRFKHPNQQAVARVIKYGSTPELVFNYRSRFNAPWNNRELKEDYGYTTLFPDRERDGITLRFE